MNPYKGVVRFFEIAGLSISVVISGAIANFLAHSTSWGFWSSLAMYVFLVAISYEIASRLQNWVFRRFVIVRKIALGDKFVEGTWFEILREDDRFVSVGIVTIEAEDYSLKIHGINYDPHGKAINYDFGSIQDMVNIAWPFVHFAYECNPRSSDKNLRGSTHIKFHSQQGSVPRHYTAAFIHSGSQQRISTEGWRITDKDEIRGLDDPARLRVIIEKRLRQAAVLDDNHPMEHFPLRSGTEGLSQAS